MQVYDFLIWTTVISVTITTILWGFASQKRVSPPPQYYFLSLITNYVNPVFCWTDPSGSSCKSFAGSEAIKTKEYTEKWNSLFLGINNILLIVFTMIYVVGLVVCAV